MVALAEMCREYSNRTLRDKRYELCGETIRFEKCNLIYCSFYGVGKVVMIDCLVHKSSGDFRGVLEMRGCYAMLDIEKQHE